MIKTLKISLLLVLLAVSFSGCNKWLERKPQDGIIREEFWQTKEQVKSAVIGIYASLLGAPNGSRSLSEFLWLWGEGRADMAAPSTQATNEDLELVNANILSTNSFTNWGAVYQTINMCNTVIELAPDVLAKDPTFTQAQLDAYLSEALAVRSLMYFYLVRSFRDVPYVTKATLSDRDILPIAKTSGDSILAMVVSDLKKAEAGAVSTFGDKASDKGRITKFTINAILADVYLWMSQYENCLTECDKIINSNQFGLLPGDAAWFNSLYVVGNSSESIFEFQFDAQKLNPFRLLFFTNRRWQASFTVLDEFFTIDLTNPDNVDIRADGASIRSGDGTIWKFVGATSTSARATDQFYTHWFVYRYADVLLMKAEALNELNRGPEALPYVYRLRQRAHALEATDLKPDSSDRVAVGNFILAERSREFAFEGKRWYDILRFARRRYTTDPDFLANMVLPAVPADKQQSVKAKYRDRNSHYFPIYFYELQTNKQLIQNPFYR